MEQWKKQLIRSLFPYSASRLNIEKAFMVKHPNVPHKLYKYRCFSDFNLDALQRNMGWMASPNTFNDPYDTAIYFDPGRNFIENESLEEFQEKIKALEEGAKPEEVWKPKKLDNPVRVKDWRRRITLEIIENESPEIQEQYREVLDHWMDKNSEGLNRRMTSHFREGYSVMSLTEDPASVLMWSHYSYNHQGYCVEYDFEALGYGDKRRRLCFPVFYRRKMTDATRYMAKKDIKDFNNLFGQYICLLKSDEWAYEKEWRIVNAIGPDHANFEWPMPLPTSIILGASVSPENEEQMRQYCSENGVCLKRIVQRHDAFRLEILDVEI